MWPPSYRRRATGLHTHITRKDLHNGMLYANCIGQKLQERHSVIFKGKSSRLITNFLTVTFVDQKEMEWHILSSEEQSTKIYYTQHSYSLGIKTSRTARSKEFVTIRLEL